MRRIVLQILKNLLLIVIILLLSLSIFSTNWAVSTFNFLNFDEVLFQLTTPIKSASSTILSSFIWESLIRALLATGVIFIVLFFIFHYFSGHRFDFTIQFKKKKFQFSINGSTFKRMIRIACFVMALGIFYYCLDKMLILDYVKAQSEESSFIEDNYVDPKEVTITFPEQKRNLIYIYVESLESTYFSEDLGGASPYNYLEPITDLTKENISFSDTELFGGAVNAKGTGWTSGAMVAQTAGIPLKNSLDNITGISTMLRGATALGNILDDNGYHQMLMIGSDKSFGNRGTYFTDHGNYDIYDYYTAKQRRKIADDYYVWWGFEDSKLFDFAKEEITSLASFDQPFNFTMLTANTHPVGGYVDEGCPYLFGNNYYNSIYCSATQLQEFVQWIQQQDFYENTTVIIVGDHTSMEENLYPEDTNRRIYNVFINSAITEGNFHNRQFTSMDLFPTTLASMGVTIEGDQLGLGTNLFSSKKTLLEEVGDQDAFDNEINKYSSFYMNNFYYS